MKNIKLIKKSAKYISKHLNNKKIDIAVIFGSGLAPSIDLFKTKKIINYKSIPHFPVSSTKGHDGKLVLTKMYDKNVLLFLGRIHYYEGFSPFEVVYPIRVIKELGIKTLILTNASGAVNKKIKAGDIMIINDQINLTGVNPLIGKNIKEHGQRFVDMTEPYSNRLIKILEKASKIQLKIGTYVGVCGPTYESKAEIKFFRSIEGDAVGMSTVLETITANHCSIETLGISCIANSASDVTKKIITHDNVLKNMEKLKLKLFNLISNFIAKV